MPSLLEVLNDPNYVNANEATKQAIFDKYSAQEDDYVNANDATKNAIRQRFGVIPIGGAELSANTSNPFMGAVGRASELVGSGVEAVARVGEKAGDALETALPLSNLSPDEIKNKRQLEPMFQFAEKLKNVSKDIGYAPTTKLSDLGKNPLTVVPFVAERIISSSPDMAAAVLASPAYIVSLSNEILNERLKNDKKTLDDATVGDVATAVGAAIFQGRFEKYATGRLFKPTVGKTGIGRVGKETAIQFGTEGIEEGVDYLGGTVGTKKGIDSKELLESMAEGAITGGGLGAGVQGVREIANRRAQKEAQAQEDLQTMLQDQINAPASRLAEAPVEQGTVVPPASEFQNVAASLAELQGKPLVSPINLAAKSDAAKDVIIQNRDRSNPASVQQMNQIASGLDYDRISYSRDFLTGAPVVAGDFKIPEMQLGKQEKITATDGTKTPIQYAVVDAKDVLPSNNADGSVNKDFFKPDYPGLIAIAGNARTAGVQAAYQRNAAQDYKNSLLNDDLHGVSREAIEQMANPMLVRVMPKSAVTKNIGDLSNIAANLNLSTVEQAKNDSNRIDLEGLKYDENGELDRNALRGFITTMPNSEQANLIDSNGKPTRQAVDRLNAAIFQKAYGNDELTAIAHEAEDGEAKNIIKALSESASKMARLEGAGEYDIRPRLLEATQLAVNARRNGIKLSDLVAQQDMTVDPLSNVILQAFAENARSSKKLAARLNSLADLAYKQTQQPAMDMLGEAPRLTTKQVVEQGIAPVEDEGLFERATPFADKFIAEEKELAKRIRAALNKMGLRDVGVNLEDALEAYSNGTMSRVNGIYFNKLIRLSLSGDNIFRSMNHEALHAMKDLGFFSAKDWSILSKKAENVWMQKYDIANPDNYGNETKEIQIEEAIAKAFADYQTETPLVKSAMTKAINALKRIGNVFKGLGFKTADDIFSKAAAGKLKETKTPSAQASYEKQTNSPEFKKWFGDSKVVDENGQPLVVYHGTDAQEDFSVFDTNKKSLKGTGSFFSRDPNKSYSSGENARIIPAYLSIKNPKYLNPSSDAFNKNNLISEGYDGVIYKGIDGTPYNVVAFYPEQIKSAIGNTGAYSPTSSDIRYERAKSTKAKPRTILGEEIPAKQQFKKLPKTAFQDKLDGIRYAVQDKYIDTKRIQQSILSAGRTIDEDQDAYLKQETYSTRSATRLENYVKDHLAPLLKDLKKNNISVLDFENYLHNRAAEERNIIIANRNPDDPSMQDGGSGIDTQVARDYLNALPAEKKKTLERLADKAYVMTKLTQDLLVSTGMEPKEKIDGWVKSNPHYVPLFREETDYEGSHFGTGSGFSSRGNFSKAAVGSKRPVVDILSNIALQYERAVKTSEKARVGRALVGLALLNPNTKFWMAINPNAITDPAAAVKGLESIGLSAEEASNLIAEPEEKYTGTFLKKRFADFKDAQQYSKDIGGFVQQDEGDADFPFKVMKQEVKTRINPANRFGPYVFPVRVNGKDWFIVFNQQDPDAKRMSESLKNMDVENAGEALQLVSKATRFFASINTQYNPVFGVINFARDFSGSMVNLSSTPLAGKQKEVAAKVLPALLDIYKDLRQERKTGTPATGKYAQLYEELKLVGGTVGFTEMFGKSQTSSDIIQREMQKLDRGSARKMADAAFNWLSDYNNAIENAMRVAVYKTGLDSGLSKERAASIAKNITVNFNRRGAKTQSYNALFAFFNAAIQGSARLAQTLNSPAGKKIMAGGVLLGVMQTVALNAAGFDEDEPPEFIKQKNLIIPTGGKSYVSIPYPLGLHIFPNVGRMAMEYTVSGGKNGTKKLGQFMGATMDAFNPLGGSGLQAQTFAPTVIDPVVAIMENRDAFGRPIAKEDRGTKPSPGYTRYRDTSSEISKQMSYFLNLASGGTKYTKGLVSPTPDQLDFLMGQLTGGVGREVLKTEQAITSLATGEELPPYKIPLAGRFYGDLKSQSAVSGKFYENVTKLSAFEDEIKGKIKDKEDYKSVFEKNPEARLWSSANTLENQISQINRNIRDLKERNADPAVIKRLQENKTRMMDNFNKRISELEK